MFLSDGIEVITLPRKDTKLDDINALAREAKAIGEDQRFAELKKMCIGVFTRRWNKFVQNILESTIRSD